MRLRNLRSFSGDISSPFIDLKPLTIFVGKNSSGKSSFLRSLPLLRQSVEAKTTGPILWFGSYVDFGAFSEAKKNNCDSDVIYFDFKLELDLIRETYKRNHYYRHRNIGRNKLDLTVEIGVSESSKKTIAKELTIKIDSNVYHFVFDKKDKCTLNINGQEEKFTSELAHFSVNQFLPLIGSFIEVDRGLGREKNTATVFEDDYIELYFADKIKYSIKKYFHQNTSLKTISDGVRQIGASRREDVKSNLQRIFKGNTIFLRNLEKYEGKICETVYELSMHSCLSKILHGINFKIENTFKNVRYIAPLRATAERYYRHQDLQIEEIDHTGSNLAMLLRSFTHAENVNFSNWTMSSFGFKVRVEEMGLHYALKIQTENDDREYNINDMGFGFSQILPIVTSIWMEVSNRKNIRKYRGTKHQLIFAIEQPELHLHPEYQSRLARMFASIIVSAKENDINLILLFETHSKTMVDTIGDCIEDDVVSNEDVNIVLFQKDIEEDSTQVKFSKFSEEGFLEEWPVGFFSGRD